MKPLILTPEVSMEAFSFQVSNIMRMELTNAIAESQQAGQLDGKRMSDIIRKHTNLSVQITLNATKTPNAYVVPPKIDKNHALLNQWRRIFASNADGVSAINFTKGEAVGSVDFEKGKVAGVFTQMTSDIYITRGAFFGYNSLVLTPGEICAMIIHEVGHVMTYFATLGQTFRTAFILDGFVRSTLNTLEPEVRIKLMKDFEDQTGVPLSDKKLIEESDQPGTITTVVLSDIVDASRSQYGTTLYDLRSWESLSDQYAARMGCAGELASAMDKLYQIYEPMYFRSTFRYLMVEVAKVLGMLIAVMASALTLNIVGFVIIFTFMSASPHEREYDNPHERLVKLRNDLIHQLKQKGVTPERTESLLADIESINRTLTHVRDRHSFFEKFWLVISPTTRRQVKMGKELQELESMVNNDLFVEAAKLKKLV